jgi:hypothetical protein
MGQHGKEFADIGRRHHLQEFIGSVVFQAAHGCSGIEEGDAFLLAKRHNIIQLKTLSLDVHEMVLVAKKHLPLYPPVVVDEVGVIEVHAPPLSLWWETTQEQYPGMSGKERTEWMVLHPTLVPADILFIQPAGVHHFSINTTFMTLLIGLTFLLTSIIHLRLQK